LGWAYSAAVIWAAIEIMGLAFRAAVNARSALGPLGSLIHEYAQVA
jgi:hypothetical protein